MDTPEDDASFGKPALLTLVPDFARMLVNARDFLIKESSIDNHYEIKRGSPNKLCERLYIDCPQLLQDACRDCISKHFAEKQNESIFDFHFLKLDGPTPLPYDLEWCWSVLLEGNIAQLEKKRMSMVCAFCIQNVPRGIKEPMIKTKSPRRKPTGTSPPSTCIFAHTNESSFDVNVSRNNKTKRTRPSTVE